ncbi:MAG: 3-carboxy-cis,cis-muconate cycloisomerase [Vicinamibacterales bacterium]
MANPSMALRLLDSLVSTEALAAVFSDEAVLEAMTRFEVALARAEAEAGVIPHSAAETIERVASHGGFDAAAIARSARQSATITIPFVEMLTGMVRGANAEAATFVHWGATSQDVSDTALVLCLVESERLIARDHGRLAAALRRLSEAHADTAMLARTLLQPAPPTTFGLKAAAWLAAADRGHARVTTAYRDACVLQFGGASGTLAALGRLGPAVAAGLSQKLQLPMPDAPWHSHRDRLATLLAACGVYAGTLGKIARDISLLMQHEVAEAHEPGGGSSSMPHKRNPAGCAIVLASANRLPGLVAGFLAGMVQEHERGVGGWQAEASTLADAVQGTGSAVAALADAVEGLRVDPDRMRSNIDATHGAVFAERAMVLLAPALGRERAGRIIADNLARASRQRGFAQLIADDPQVQAALDAKVLETLGDATAYLGSADYFQRRLLKLND